MIETPRDLDTERGLLGSVLLCPELMDDAQVTARDFYDPKHAAMWRVMAKMHRQGEAPGLMAISPLLDIDSTGGTAYAIDCTQMSSGRSYYPQCERRVIDLARRRQGLDRCRDLIECLQDIGEPLGDATMSKFGALGAILDGSQASEWSSIGEAVEAAERALTDRINGVARKSVTTGISALDQIIGGLEAGRLYVVGARPGMGKTSLALKLLHSVGLHGGAGVAAMFSLEMPKEELAERLCVAVSQISGDRVRRGQLTRDQMHRWLDASEQLRELPIQIDDSPLRGVEQVRAQARSLARQCGGLTLVVVDYLQLMSTDGGRNANMVIEVGKISRGLKILARELDCPVVALSQLNRALERRDDKRPQLADLRQSGSIEQDADVVAFLYRDAVYNPDTAPAHELEIVVAKQRNGPTGVAMCQWDGETMSVGDVSCEF